MTNHPDERPQSILRLTNRAESGERPEGVDAPFVSDRLTTLTHELSNLLDGSLRCLALARQCLGDPGAPTAGADLDKTRKQVETVYEALQRMSSLVRAASGGGISVIGWPGLVDGETVTLTDALLHAIDVVRPIADDWNITIQTEIQPAAGQTPAAAVYSVVLNGIRNAIESIGQAGKGGEIRVVVRGEPTHARDHESVERVVIQIIDDGVGPPPSDRVFEHGISMRPGGSGIGLALSRALVARMNGTIELQSRNDDDGRGGAILHIAYPAPKPPTHKLFG